MHDPHGYETDKVANKGEGGSHHKVIPDKSVETWPFRGSHTKVDSIYEVNKIGKNVGGIGIEEEPEESAWHEEEAPCTRVCDMRQGEGGQGGHEVRDKRERHVLNEIEIINSPRKKNA